MSSTQSAGEKDLNSSAASLQPYDLGLKEIPIPIKDGAQRFVIVVGKPSRAANEKRERMSKIIKRTAAKVDDQDAVTIIQDNARANEVFAKAIALKVKGYVIGGVEPEGNLPLDPQGFLDAQLIVAAGADPEIAKSYGVQPDREGKYNIRVIDLIPGRHINLVANALYGGRFTVDRPESQVLSVRTQRLGTVKQEMGVVSLENGELSDPTHVIEWRLKDPTSAGVGKFDSRAITGTTIFLKGGGTEEHRIVSLAVCEELFDEHIAGAEGCVVNGEAFDARNPAHLKEVDGGLKKSVVMLYFNGIQVESGN